MKSRTTLPLLLVLTAVISSAASAQSLDTFATIPAAPAPGDSVVLRLSGQWPDGCVPTPAITHLTRDGSAIRVNFNYSGLPGPCTAAITPWSLDVPVGTLSEGSYRVEVTRTLTLIPSQTIGSRAFTVAPVAEATVWLPGFFAPGAPYSLASTLTAYNNSGRNATVTYLNAWDELGPHTPPAPVELDPLAAGILDSHTLREGQHVQMLSLRAPRGIAIRATLERLATAPAGGVAESLGRLELPVFTELFPANSTAVAGDVSLSASECAGSPETRRRVNLTLFNAGDAKATFRVSAISAAASPGSGSQEFEVPASSVVQFNALQIDTLPVCDAGGAWFRVTGDQPFLAYVSTVRPEKAAGVLPYEIFPARLDR